MLKVLQSTSPYAAYISIPSFALNVPDPLVLESALSAAVSDLYAAGLPQGSPLVGFGHSLGGQILQAHVAQTGGIINAGGVMGAGSSAALNAGSSRLSALLLGGCSLQRKYRTDNETGPVNFPLRTLSVSGTLDGLYRVTRQAEGFYFQVPAGELASSVPYPIVVVEGMSHMQFSSGAPPPEVKRQDLKPDISYSAAYSLISGAANAFLAVTLGGPGIDVPGATSALQGMLEETRAIVAPIIVALVYESNVHIAPACNSDSPRPPYCPFYPHYPGVHLNNNPQPPRCVCGVQSTARAQEVMGIASTTPPFPSTVSIRSINAVHAVSEISPIHLPHMWNSCPASSTEPCALNITTVTQVTNANFFYPT